MSVKMSSDTRMTYGTSHSHHHNNRQSYQGQDIRPESPSDPEDPSTQMLNMNQYATKKTLAQGMLDLALLTANVSQLKYLLDVGELHPYFHILLPLIILSICMQTAQAIVCVILGLIFDLNNVEEHKAANIYNNICLIIIIVVTVVNIVISGFDLKTDTFFNLRTMNGN